MSNIQPSLQQGINSIKKGIEMGKTKLKTSQEMMAIREQLNQNQQKRTERMLALGELAYNSIRNGKLVDNTMNSIVDEIIALDKYIFESFKAIDEKIKEERGLVCECGASLLPENKFCMNCGKKVQGSSTENDQEELTICRRCETEIPVSFQYCNCCGGKIGQGGICICTVDIAVKRMKILHSIAQEMELYYMKTKKI